MLDTSQIPFWDRLMEGIVRKEYELLTGAGFSRDARDRKGRPLPLGDALRDELVEHFALPESTDSARKPTLTQVYALCQNRPSKSENLDVTEWLRLRFSRTCPPNWYRLLQDISFNTIWTVNIDDALDISLGNRVRPFHYFDKTVTLPSDSTPLVHLHGQATRPEKGLVFALDEYVSRILAPRPFAQRFQESLPGNPFIVVGANLSAEVDIATSLKGRMPDVETFPSVVVRPNFDEFSKLEVESWGFNAVASTAEDFFRAVHDDLPKTMRRLAPTMAAEDHISPLNSRFAHQWVTPEATRAPRAQNLLAGDEPFYSDVKKDLTFRRTLEKEISHEIISGDGLILLRGSPYSGKSTMALRIARAFALKHWNVYLFQGDEGVDVDAAIASIRYYPNTLLVIDNAGLYAKTVLQLVDRAEQQGVALHVLCADRDGPATRIRRHDVFREYPCQVRMSPPEFDSYISLLDSRDLLNQLWRGVRSNTLAEEVGRDFVSIISSCVVGQTFERRVRDEVERLGDSKLRNVLLLSCIFSRVSRGVDLPLLAKALGEEVRDLVAEIDASNSLSSLVRISNGSIRPRHHRLAEALLESKSFGSDSIDALSSFAKVLSSRVDPGAISQNTRHYRMAVALLDQELLANVIGRDRVDEVYESIEAEYTWNSRYWEQRALAASSRAHYDDAIKWSETALSVYEDAYSLNTSAAILFKHLFSASIPADRISAVATRAVARVRAARESSRDDSEYPYVTFFHNAPGLLRLIRLGKVSEYTEARIVEEWNGWESAAMDSIAFNYPEGVSKLKKFRGAWTKERVRHSRE